jgi:hypothetical protein
VTFRPLATLAALAALASFALPAAPARAQGTLSTQGYGYPPGQLSTRAQGTGGAVGEFDPLTPINPAALASLVRSAVFFQYAPEVRRVSAGDRSNRSVLQRFPLVGAAMGFGERVMVGAAASTLADRTWQTDERVLIGEGSDTTTALASFRATGGLTDVRLAASYALHPSLRLGAGFHALIGNSRAQRDLIFADTLRYRSFREQQAFSFSGKGVSAGVEWRPVRTLAIAASARAGGTVTAWSGDTARSRGSFPRRVGAGIQYAGIGGALLAVRTEWNEWSRLSGLSLTGVPVHDAWDWSAGVEAKGPRLFNTDLPVRAGFRRRTLPFGLPGGAEVRESGVSGGLSIPLARNRAMADFAAERDSRTAAGGVTERAWVLSFGFLVRL